MSRIMDEKFKKECKYLLEEIGQIKNTVNETEEKIESVTSQYEEIKRENEELKTEIKALKMVNTNLHDRIEEMEKYSKKNNMIITGIPSDRDENVQEIIKTLAKELDVDLQEYHINAHMEEHPGTSARRTAQQLGHKRETVRKALKEEGFYQCCTN